MPYFYDSMCSGLISIIMRYHIYFWKQSNVVYISTLFQKQRVIIQFIVIFFVYTLKTRRQLLLNNKNSNNRYTLTSFQYFLFSRWQNIELHQRSSFWNQIRKPHLQFIPFILVDRPVVWSEEIFSFLSVPINISNTR